MAPSYPKQWFRICLCVPLTTKAIIFVGSDYKALYKEIIGNLQKMIVVLVEGSATLSSKQDQQTQPKQELHGIYRLLGLVVPGTGGVLLLMI